MRTTLLVDKETFLKNTKMVFFLLCNSANQPPVEIITLQSLLVSWLDDMECVVVRHKEVGTRNTRNLIL